MNSRRTVLIAEDDADFRKVLTFDFQRLGFNVIEASSGNRALDLIQKNQVDLILSDIIMPDGDGISLLSALTQKGIKPVFVFMTGYTHLSRTEALEMGADGYLTKPFNRQELAELVKAKLPKLSPA